MPKSRFSRYLLLGLALICLQLNAQEEDSAPAPADEPDIPADEFARGTPLRSAEGFVTAVDEGEFETAAEYLDLRNLRGASRQLTGEQLSRRLGVIINRATWVEIDELVDDPAGRSNDNLPDYRDSIGIVLDEDKEVRLFMQRVPRGDGVSIWKISNATVALVPDLYDTYGYLEIVEDLRRSVPNVSFVGLELFKWIIVFVVGVFAYSVIFLTALVVRQILGDPDTPSHRRIFRFLVIPFGIWVVLMSVNSVTASLGLGVTAGAIQEVSPLPALITVWVMYVGMNLMRDMYSARLDDRGRPGAVVLLGPATSAIKLLIAVAAVLVYLDKLGINITTVLAGLGVGGIAIALALQKPMEDIFGAITLYTQQPIRVGDFCRIGNDTGTIEEIGLRTTRIRTLANTLIAVPNARLATEPIDNISAREKIRYRPILRLGYDTTPQQLQQILEGIRNLLSSDEKVLEENNRVRFKEISEDALLVEVFAYVATTDWPEYLEIAEQLNIRILEIIAQAGTSLALPAQTLYVEQSAASERPS